jgi:AraC-like DNA-binding protein
MLFTATHIFQLILLVLSALLGGYLLLVRRPIALAIFFLSITLQSSFYLLNTVFPQINAPDIGSSLRFIYGAAIYFTVRELLYGDFHYKWKHLWHFAPFLIAVLCSNDLIQFPGEKIILSIGLSITLMAYLIATYRQLNNYDKVIDDTRSDGVSSIVIGIRRVLHVYTAVLIFEILRYGIGLTANPALTFILHYVFLSAASIGLATAVLIGLRRPSLLPRIDNADIALTLAVSKYLESLENAKIDASNNDNNPVDNITLTDAETLPTSTNDTITEKEFSSTHRPRTINRELEYRLNQCMLEDKPFLDNQLTIRQLAKQLQAPARAVSELINEAHHCNFSEFINKARVAEAQRLMQSSQWAEQSLLEIALSSGFNSKTSFNTMFRRFTDQTPSDYRQQLEQSLKT